MSTPSDSTNVPSIDIWALVTLIKKRFENQVGGSVINRLPIKVEGVLSSDQLKTLVREVDGHQLNGWHLVWREPQRTFVIQRG